MNIFGDSNPRDPCTYDDCIGCRREFNAEHLKHGRCAACNATFEAGVEAAVAAMLTQAALDLVTFGRTPFMCDRVEALAEHVRRAVKR